MRQRCLYEIAMCLFFFSLLSGCGGGGSETLNGVALELSAAAVSSTSIDLSWTDNYSDETGFSIERSRTSVSSDFVEIAFIDPDVQTYSDTGGAAATTYWYRVVAYDAGGEAGLSNVASVTTPGTGAGLVPFPPTGLAATAVSSSAIELTWTDNSGDENGFRIERSGTSSSTGFAAIAVVGPGIETYFDDQESGGDGRRPGGGGDGPGSGGGGTRPAGLSVGSVSIPLALTAAKTYWYRVVAYNSSGNSDFSNIASATTQPSPTGTVPAPPTNLSASATSSTTIDLNWTDTSSDEDGFRIERSSTSSTTGFSSVANTGVGSQSYSDSGLAASTTYWYRIAAFNGTGDSDYSNTARVTTQDPLLSTPVAPTNLVATTQSSTSIRLDWTDTAGNEDGFKVEKAVSSSGPWSEINGVTANATTYTSIYLTPLTTYYFRIRAYNSAGYSDYSNIVTAQTQAHPAAPVLTVGAANASGQYPFEWTYTFSMPYGSTKDGYEFQESETSATSGYVTLYSTVGQDDQENSKQVWVTPDGTGLRYYRVRANDDEAFTSWSNLVTVNASGPSTILRITNNLSQNAANRVLTVRISQNNNDLCKAIYERLEAYDYCEPFPGIDISPGESMDFDVSAEAPNYNLYVGVGLWTDDGKASLCQTGWHKKLWTVDGNFNVLYGPWVSVGVAHPLGSTLELFINYNGEQIVGTINGFTQAFTYLVGTDPLLGGDCP